MIDEQIVSLYQDGWSFKRLVVASGKSLNYIRKRLRDAGVQHRLVGLPKGSKVSDSHREHLKRVRTGRKPSLGMKHSEETRRKMSESRRGSGNPRWVDGRKQTPYPPEWTKALRLNICSRQLHTCAFCGSESKLSVHHIDFNKTNCSIENLVALCTKCHGIVHRNKNAEGCRRVLKLYVVFRDTKFDAGFSNSKDS